jgi:hypothetical protein
MYQKKKKNSKASFGSRNKLLEWNDYSIKIAIPLFGRDLFLGIAPTFFIFLFFFKIWVILFLKNKKLCRIFFFLVILGQFQL